MGELARLDHGASVDAEVFNALVAIVESLGRVVDNLDARVELLIDYLGVDEPADIVDLPDLSTYQPEEAR